MTANLVELESLWNHERARLVRYMRRRVGPMDAEDAVQDVFVRLLSANERGGGYTEHATGYLYRTAHNLIIDGYRGRDRAKDAVELDAPHFRAGETTVGELIACDAMQPDELAMQSETVREVRFALSRIPDDQCAVIIRRMEGYEFETIAQELDRSEGAIKALQTRGYTAMHKFLTTRLGYVGDRAVKTSRVEEVKALLLYKGPLTRRDIYTQLGATENSISGALWCYKETFTRVGTTEASGQTATLWGLKGVHDQQEAA